MPRTKTAAAALLLAIPLLAACQSTSGGSSGARASRSSPVAPTLADYGALQIALGRQALDDGLYGTAVTAFRNARQVPQWDAAACNGLAIAYSRIGRPDLAERYFTQAMTLAPEEPRYLANLQRFHQAQAMVRDDAERVAAAALNEMESSRRNQAAAALPPGIHVVLGRNVRGIVTSASPPSRLVRLSATEVRLGGEAAPLRSASAPRTTRLAARSPSYPIRIELNAAR